MKANAMAFWVVVIVVLFIASEMARPSRAQAALPSDRFVVVSQQYVESGAKVIVLRDTHQPDRECYVIYEAGAPVILDAKTTCR